MTHLQKWKGKAADELAKDDDFFEAIISGTKPRFLMILELNILYMRIM